MAGSGSTVLRLSVLDQSPVRDGQTPGEAIRETLDLAQAADRLGYHRYWLAEHHSTSGLADAAPEILIAAVAAGTRRIRVGSGGVMLTHYSPLKVAEQFRMLETLHPGRIDLGHRARAREATPAPRSPSAGAARRPPVPLSPTRGRRARSRASPSRSATSSAS